jgi:hypothetical protein
MHTTPCVCPRHCRVGAAQNWTSDWASFTGSDFGSWSATIPGQRWLDVRTTSVRNIMAQVGCGVAWRGCVYVLCVGQGSSYRRCAGGMWAAAVCAFGICWTIHVKWCIHGAIDLVTGHNQV